MINLNFVPALIKSYNDYRNQDVYKHDFKNFESTPCVLECRNLIKMEGLYPFVQKKFKKSTFNLDEGFCLLESESNLEFYEPDDSSMFNKYLDSVKQQFSDKFYGELWLGTLHGNWHLKVVKYNESFNLFCSNREEKVLTETFNPVCMVCELIKPIIIEWNIFHDMLKLEDTNYSASLREYFSDFKTKLKGKFLNKKYYLPVEENKKETWYKYIFPNLGFKEDTVDSIVEISIKRSLYYRKNKLSYYQMLSVEFVKATLYMAQTNSEDRTTFGNMYKIIKISPHDFPNFSTIAPLILQNLTKVPQETLSKLKIQFREIKSFLSSEFSKSNKVIVHGYVPKLQSDSSIFVDILNYVGLVPTFDDNFMQIVETATENKLDTMSWRDYNANVYVYNKFIAPKLNLAKKITRFTNLDNNLRKRVERIVEGLNDMEFYDIFYIQECIKSYFLKGGQMSKLVVSDLDETPGERVSILDNFEIKEITERFSSCLKDDFGIDEEDLNSVEAEVFNKRLKERETISLIQDCIRVKHYKNEMHDCQVKRRQCKKASLKDLSQLIYTNVLRNVEVRAQETKNKNLKEFIEEYLKSYSYILDYGLINDGELLIQSKDDLLRMETEISKDFLSRSELLKVLVTGKDFGEYFKIKGFSKQAFMIIFKKRVSDVAEEIILDWKINGSYHYKKDKIGYNQKTMRIEINNISLNILNERLNKKKVEIQVDVLKNYKNYLEEEEKTTTINLNKIVDSIKYYICKSRINRKNHYKEDKTHILKMKRNDFVATIDILVDNAYLNKKVLNVKKGVRNFIRALVLYVGFDNVFGDEIDYSLKVRLSDIEWI